MFNQDEIKPLVEKEAATNWLFIVSGIFLAVATFVSINSAMSIIGVLNNDTIPLVVCPRSYELDAPVLLKTIPLSSAAVKDKWIKGFIRRFVQAQFPRSEEDAERHLRYVVAHSAGQMRRLYDGYLDELSNFKSLLNQGYYYSFYPTNTLDVRIRSTGSEGEWAVEIDGFMVRSGNNFEERTTPTLQYVVRAGDHTMENPEGLYVVDSNIVKIADYVSGRKDER